MSAKREIHVETLAGIIIPKLESNGEVTVNMGAPKFEPDEIPFVAEKRASTYRLDISMANRWRSVLCPWATPTRFNW